MQVFLCVYVCVCFVISNVVLVELSAFVISCLMQVFLCVCVFLFYFLLKIQSEEFDESVSEGNEVGLIKLQSLDRVDAWSSDGCIQHAG